MLIRKKCRANVNKIRKVSLVTRNRLCGLTVKILKVNKTTEVKSFKYLFSDSTVRTRIKIIKFKSNNKT